MKRFCFIISIVLLGLVSCSKINIKKNAPPCIKSKIIDFDKSHACPKGADVKEFLFQNKTVYVFNPGNCGADMTSEVTDEQCNSLGFLGGFAGNTKINGEDFSRARYKGTVWTDK